MRYADLSLPRLSRFIPHFSISPGAGRVANGVTAVCRYMALGSVLGNAIS